MSRFNLKFINFTEPYNPSVLANILHNYAFFKSPVDKLQEELSIVDNYKKHPAFLDLGRTVRVFALSLDGTPYAVRLISQDIRQQHFYARLCGGSLAANLPGLERIVAASLDTHVTVSHLMPGQKLAKLPAEELAFISTEQIAKLIDSLVLAYESGVLIDTSPSNLFYDRRAGFGIIDYISVGGLSYSLGYLLAAVIRGFNFDFEHRIRNMTRAAVSPQNIENFCAAKIQIISLYLQAAKERLSTKDFQITISATKIMLTTLKRMAKYYGINLYWSEWRDSNPRPLAPHASTLANCATPRL
ncbi:hypothetical protein NO2_0518 [Candidatus Termititenax persephonae]|uniref:Protein kinase domain-containing protein n=1 Tax=Candidatus Termititenax persephonae TaxID=2218525 RepID=A0A388TFP4_9BACT|nr:hypothetical protein NO2_0518 [Candidatus Termititenax persephonae]